MLSKRSVLLAAVGSSWLIWSSVALSSGEGPTNGRPVPTTTTATTFEGIAPPLPLPQDTPNAALLSRSDLTEQSVPGMTVVPKMSESCKFSCGLVILVGLVCNSLSLFRSSLLSDGAPCSFHGKSSC